MQISYAAAAAYNNLVSLAHGLERLVAVLLAGRIPEGGTGVMRLSSGVERCQAVNLPVRV